MMEDDDNRFCRLAQVSGQTEADITDVTELKEFANSLEKLKISKLKTWGDSNTRYLGASD